jgi:hypothetical protein
MKKGIFSFDFYKCSNLNCERAYRFFIYDRTSNISMSKKGSRSSKKRVSKKVNRMKNIAKRTKQQKPPQLIEGEERKVHEQIIDRRVTGGTSLSKDEITEAYARALKQWQELPGSIVRPPTDITLPNQKERKSQDTKTTSEQSQNNTNNGGA